MITSAKINSVQAKIKAAIAQIAREENVDISFGSCRYDSAKYNTTMTVKTKVITERVITVNDNTSKMLGFDGNVIGRFTVVNGKTFTITDIKTRNRTYPIIAEFEGKSYKLSVAQVKRGLLNLTK
jgi:restriction endonuclease S subunit